MKIHKINDLSNVDAVSILTTGLEKISEQDLSFNYHPYYKDKPENIFSMLSSGKFDKGNYYILEEGGKYIGSAGWYPYTDDVVLVLVRAYIIPSFRTNYLMAEYFLPRIFEETTEYKKLWITCNDYNKSIYDALVKLSKNQNAGMFNSWPDIYKKFTPIGTKVVNNTPQYVAEYER